MKPYVFMMMVVLVVLEGCATHYYRVENDSIHIYLKESSARDVYFASSVDGFQPHKVEKSHMNTWQIQVPVNDEFRYFYIVNGDVFLPSCKFKEKDDFGFENCIFIPE